MDPAATRYVRQLKETRCDEATRRDERRALRASFLVQQHRDRQAELRNALRQRVRQRAADPAVSLVEQNLFDALRRTAAWWDSICDHAVERKVTTERAEACQRSNQIEYLRTVETHERQEQANVLGTDTTRWLAAKAAYLQSERDRQTAAIGQAISLLLNNTNSCIDFLSKFAIEDSRSSVLAQFGLEEVVRQSYLPPAEDGSEDDQLDRDTARRAFQALFHGQNPLRMCTPYFPPLLRTLLAKMQLDSCRGKGTGARLFFDVSRVPVFAVIGAKYSGKSILTDYLVKSFGFRCFSDIDLVTKALRASEEAEAETDGKDREEKVEEREEKEHEGEAAAGGDEAVEPRSPHHDAWALIGSALRAELLGGGAVPAEILAQLFAMQLAEVQDDEDVKGVVFDGVLSSAAVCQATQDTILPRPAVSLEAIIDEWCSPKEEAPVVSAVPTPVSNSPVNNNNHSNNSNDNGAAAEMAAEPVAETYGVAAWFPPVVAPVEELPTRKDNKARSAKKTVDLSSLPPPVLPEVDDVADELDRERAFVEKAAGELTSGYGGFLSALFYIDCPPAEIFQRYAGLRYDRETGTEYHMTYDPPPEERTAYLVNVDRTAAHAAQLAEIVFQQQQEWHVMRRWLHERRTTSASQVVELDGSASVRDLEAEAAEAVRQALANFEAGKRLRAAMHESQETIHRLETQRRAQGAAREAERQRLADLYTEKGVFPLPPELVRGAGGAGTHLISPAAAASTDGSGTEAPVQDEAAASRALCEEIPSGVDDVILSALAVLSDTYKSTYSDAWRSVGGAAKLLLGYRVAAQTHIRNYWEATTDGKQALLNRFVRVFNTMPNNLRSLHACKEEMHSLADELKTALFASVELRKKECKALVELTTRREAFLDGWDANIGNLGALMVQAEASRFTEMVNLIAFYFNAMLGETVAPEDVDSADTGLFPMPNGSLTEGSASITDALPCGTFSSSLTAGMSPPGVKRQGTSGKKSSPHGNVSVAAGGGGAGAGAGKAAAGNEDGANANGGMTETPTQEAFADAVARAVLALQTLVERLRVAARGAPGKADKKGANAVSSVSLHAALSANPAKTSALVSRCLPIIESELAKTQERIEMVRAYIAELMHQGETYRMKIRSELYADVTQVIHAEAVAVNTAIYVVRGRIEEERLCPHMHLGCGTFAVLKEAENETGHGVGSHGREKLASGEARQPSFITDVPLYQELAARRVMLHSTLSSVRLLALIDTFCAVAPDYQLSRDNFMLTVEEADYAGATAACASPTTAEPPVDNLKTTSDVFRAFDVQGCGFIDWREFVMHLLFWCTPPPTRRADANHTAGPSELLSSKGSLLPTSSGDAPYYIPELAIEDLLDVKADLGMEPLPAEDFRSRPFLFEEYVPEATMQAFKEALWRTFCDRATGAFDTFAFLYFLCSDVQPVRGAQKAFYVLSSAAKDGDGITREEMERIFHTHATNPRALGKYDAFAKRNLRLLYDRNMPTTPTKAPSALLTFQGMCSAVMGRKMLNSFDVFRRKRFVTSE